MATVVHRSVGRSRVESLLGSGCTAEVYQALDGQLGRSVAVEIIRPAVAAQPEFLERVLR